MVPIQTGPPRGMAQNLTGAPWQPVELKLWAADQKATYDPEEGLMRCGARSWARHRSGSRRTRS